MRGTLLCLIRAGVAMVSAVLITLAAPAAAAGPPTPAAQDTVSARAYPVRFRPLSDAADLVGTVLSPDGSMTLQPKLKTLIVQDHPQVLERVASLLQSFDLPPRNVEVTLSLFLGTDRREGEAGRQTVSGTPSREVRGVTETLGDVTKWSAYEPLGSRSVIGIEGSPITASLSGDYRVLLEVESVQEARGELVVKFRRCTLQKVIRGEGGERTEDLVTTAIVIPAGRLLVVGAAKGPDSKKALFLTLQARPR